MTDRVDRATFQPVGIPKFVVMTVATFGVYLAYWAYWQWQHVRRVTGLALSAGWRGFVYFAYAPALFRFAHASARQRGIAAGWSPTALGLAQLVLTLATLVVPPWLLPLLMLAVAASYVPVVHTVNALARHDDPDVAANARFSTRNLIALAAGLAVFAVFALADTMATSTLDGYFPR